MRGGSWFSSGCTSAHRAPTYIGFFCSDIGFRVVVECGSSIGGDAPDSSKAETLNGTFDFPEGGPTKNIPIKIVLTPTANEYTAVYYFNILGKDRKFSGTFKRNPQTGEASGTATSTEPGNAQFLFRGKPADGVLNCQHYALTKGKEKSTGTMTLKLPRWLPREEAVQELSASPGTDRRSGTSPRLVAEEGQPSPARKKEKTISSAPRPPRPKPAKFPVNE